MNLNVIRGVWAVLLISITFCAANRSSDLTERVENYNESLRWASVKAAAIFMAEEKKSEMIEQYSKEFKKNHMVDYSIMDIKMDESKSLAHVLVEFSYYDQSTQILEYRQEHQEWKFQPKSQQWYVASSVMNVDPDKKIQKP